MPAGLAQHDNEKLDCYVAKLGIDIGIAIGIGFSAWRHR
jgi:hypothetical protein